MLVSKICVCVLVALFLKGAPAFRTDLFSKAPRAEPPAAPVACAKAVVVLATVPEEPPAARESQTAREADHVTLVASVALRGP